MKYLSNRAESINHRVTQVPSLARETRTNSENHTAHDLRITALEEQQTKLGESQKQVETKQDKHVDAVASKLTSLMFWLDNLQDDHDEARRERCRYQHEQTEKEKLRESRKFAELFVTGLLMVITVGVCKILQLQQEKDN